VGNAAPDRKTATVSSNTRAAQRYAECGYPVLAVWGLRNGACTCPEASDCKTPGKHPIERQWQRHATLDKDAIQKLFNRYPGAHIGIMPPKGCVIVDVDPRNGGDKLIKKLRGSQRVPATPVQRSGGGGWHYVFKGDMRSPGKGIDVKRAGGGFVVAWPAAHIEGGANSYAWDLAPWVTKPASLPSWLSDYASEPHNDEHNTHNETQTLVPLNRIKDALAYVPADSYHTWINVGQALRHTYADDGEDTWIEWSQTSPKYKEGDARKWNTFDKNRDRPLLTIRTIMHMARRNGWRMRTATEVFDDSLFGRGNIARLLGETPEPLNWIIEPCIAAGKLTMLSGMGGSSKSFLTLTLAAHYACGLEWAGMQPGTPGKVLILTAEEDRDDIHRRLHTVVTQHMFNDEQLKQIGENLSIVPTRGEDWRLVEMDQSNNAMSTERLDYLIEQISKEEEARLVVLDPFSSFNGVNENDNAAMSYFMNQLDRLCIETGIAVLLLHHAAKTTGAQSVIDVTQSGVRGASALVDAARCVMFLMRVPINEAAHYEIKPDDASRHVVLRMVKNNFGSMMQDSVFAIQGGGGLRHAPEIKRVQGTVAKINPAVLRTMQALLENPATTQTQLGLITGKGQSAVSRLLHQFMQEEWVERRGAGPTTKYVPTEKGLRAVGIDAMDGIV